MNEVLKGVREVNGTSVISYRDWVNRLARPGMKHAHRYSFSVQFTGSDVGYASANTPEQALISAVWATGYTHHWLAMRLIVARLSGERFDVLLRKVKNCFGDVYSHAGEEGL